MQLDRDPLAELLLEPLSQPGPRLLRAEDVYGHIKLIESEIPLCEWAYRLHPPQFIDRMIPDLTARGQMSDATTVARVEDGRWIAECPFCASAQVVSPLDPRYLCAGPDGCANANVRGAYASVIFPSEKTRDQLEAVLLERPDRLTRNWMPRESVSDLVAENVAMLTVEPAAPDLIEENEL